MTVHVEGTIADCKRRNPPTHLLEVGKQTHEFFNCHVSQGRKTYTLKPMEQYAAEHRTNESPSKQYFKQTRLKDIIMEYPYSKKNAKQSDIDKGRSSGVVTVMSLPEIFRRDGATHRLCRFRRGFVESRPDPEMVTAASGKAPVHHWREIHRALPGQSDLHRITGRVR